MAEAKWKLKQSHPQITQITQIRTFKFLTVFCVLCNLRNLWMIFFSARVRDATNRFPIYDSRITIGRMQWTKVLLLLLICPSIFAGQKSRRTSSPPSDADRLRSMVTIYRDTYGVPHVFGSTDASTVFGFAYAQAEDNFWRVEENFILALGRASELYGERTLNDDRLNHALEIPRLARERACSARSRARKQASLDVHRISRVQSHSRAWVAAARGQLTGHSAAGRCGTDLPAARPG
jgi:hypothetical protein